MGGSWRRVGRWTMTDDTTSPGEARDRARQRLTRTARRRGRAQSAGRRAAPTAAAAARGPGGPARAAAGRGRRRAARRRPRSAPGWRAPSPPDTASAGRPRRRTSRPPSSARPRLDAVGDAAASRGADGTRSIGRRGGRQPAQRARCHDRARTATPTALPAAPARRDPVLAPPTEGRGRRAAGPTLLGGDPSAAGRPALVLDRRPHPAGQPGAAGLPLPGRVGDACPGAAGPAGARPGRRRPAVAPDGSRVRVRVVRWELPSAGTGLWSSWARRGGRAAAARGRPLDRRAGAAAPGRAVELRAGHRPAAPQRHPRRAVPLDRGRPDAAAGPVEGEQVALLCQGLRFGDGPRAPRPRCRCPARAAELPRRGGVRPGRHPAADRRPGPRPEPGAGGPAPARAVRPALRRPDGDGSRRGRAVRPAGRVVDANPGLCELLDAAGAPARHRCGPERRLRHPTRTRSARSAAGPGRCRTGCARCRRARGTATGWTTSRCGAATARRCGASWPCRSPTPDGWLALAGGLHRRPSGAGPPSCCAAPAAWTS